MAYTLVLETNVLTGVKVQVLSGAPSLSVAQSVEQLSDTQQVGGAIPSAKTKFTKCFLSSRVERLPYKKRVVGANPTGSTILS
jgi:hypothetical protein